MTSTPRPSSSEKAASTAPTQRDLNVDDQSRPRAPTPFQENPKLSREDSVVDNPERIQGGLPTPDTGSRTDIPQCEDGKHEYKTKHGLMGILMAIALFPCGLICFFRDKETVCVKCATHA